jgi:hypothetical protein
MQDLCGGSTKELCGRSTEDVRAAMEDLGCVTGLMTLIVKMVTSQFEGIQSYIRTENITISNSQFAV